MTKLNKAQINSKAHELNFNRDTYEKVTRLLHILEFMNSNSEINQYLALKGGTAINLTLFNLPRLSVDIDLDLVKPVNKSEMLLIREKLTKSISNYMDSENYTMNKRSKSSHSLDSLIFQYVGVSGNIDNIKIEINYSLRAHIDLPKFIDISVPYFDSHFKIHRLSKSEIYSSKISALLSRLAARDLYDVYNMIKYSIFESNELDHLKKSIIFYSALSLKNDYSIYNIDSIDLISENKIKRDLRPLLSKNEHFDLKNAKEIVKKYLHKLLLLTNEEKEFLDLFLQKKYEPSLLFNQNDIVQRIQNHPMIEWKIKRRSQ